MSTAKFEGSARNRLLAAANELFYAEGVHTVGIDRVIERAGVAKASLYSAFGSKEELVLAYLQLRADTRAKRILARIAQHDSARARIIGIFELLCELVAEPNFRGCAFANASAEGPPGESKVSQVCIDSRAWTRRLLADLAREAGAPNFEQLGRQLALVYDGAIVGASVDRDPGAAREALETARMLLDAQLPAQAKKAQPHKRTAKAAARSKA
jgi:AcrR family transcriptional regulator